MITIRTVPQVSDIAAVSAGIEDCACLIFGVLISRLGRCSLIR